MPTEGCAAASGVLSWSPSGMRSYPRGAQSAAHRHRQQLVVIRRLLRSNDPGFRHTFAERLVLEGPVEGRCGGMMCTVRRSALLHLGLVEFDMVVPARLAGFWFEGAGHSAPFVLLAAHACPSAQSTTTDILHLLRGEVDAHSGTLPILLGDWDVVHPPGGGSWRMGQRLIHMNRTQRLSATSRRGPHGRADSQAARCSGG